MNPDHHARQPLDRRDMRNPREATSVHHRRARDAGFQGHIDTLFNAGRLLEAIGSAIGGGR